MERKKLRSSKRGLTFSFRDTRSFHPGSRYRYILDIKNGEIMIVPSESGNTVSRKKQPKTAEVKSLIDIRSQMVRQMVAKADYMVVEIKEDQIMVRLLKAVAESAQAEVETVGCIHMSRTFLNAVGAEFAQPSMFESSDLEMKNVPFFISRKGDDGSEFSDVLRVISLFSGAGMLDYTFAKDDKFQIVFAAEYDTDAVETYRNNLGSHVRKVDIRTLTAKDLPPADIIIGGPPCQPYSNSNRHAKARFEAHKEGDMFAHYVRLVKESQVKAFVIENVPSLLSCNDCAYVKYLQEMLPNYDLAAKLLVDTDLGGFTKRKRAVIVGSRIGKPVIPDMRVYPPHTSKEALLRVNDSWPNAQDITVSSPEVTKRIAMIPEGGNWMDLPKELWTKSVQSNMYRRLDRNKPSVTIANWRKYLLSPPRWDSSGKWDRILSVSEAAALQGFGPDYKFFGSLGSKQQQVANGCTLATGKFIKSILKSMFVNFSTSPMKFEFA